MAAGCLDPADGSVRLSHRRRFGIHPLQPRGRPIELRRSDDEEYRGPTEYTEYDGSTVHAFGKAVIIFVCSPPTWPAVRAAASEATIASTITTVAWGILL